MPVWHILITSFLEMRRQLLSVMSTLYLQKTSSNEIHSYIYLHAWYGCNDDMRQNLDLIYELLRHF